MLFSVKRTQKIKIPFGAIKNSLYLCNVIKKVTPTRRLPWNHIILEIMKTLLTLVVYKNEYKPLHVEFFKKSFAVVNESEKALEIEGYENELEKVQKLMFATDEEVKAEFPTFVTEEERRAYTEKRFHEVCDTMRNTLLDMIQNGAVNEDFRQLKETYFKLQEYINK
jgi:hypothetical protein